MGEDGRPNSGAGGEEGGRHWAEEAAPDACVENSQPSHMLYTQPLECGPFNHCVPLVHTGLGLIFLNFLKKFGWEILPKISYFKKSYPCLPWQVL